MKKLILRILVQATLMALVVVLAVVAGAVLLQVPQPLGILLTFVAWVAIGIGWQELSQYITRRWGL